MDLIFDPTSEQTAVKCWDGVINRPEQWTSTVASQSQGQAWWSEEDGRALLLYRDQHGLVMAYEFTDDALNHMENIESGRKLWNAISNLLLRSSIAD